LSSQEVCRSVVGCIQKTAMRASRYVLLVDAKLTLLTGLLTYLLLADDWTRYGHETKKNKNIKDVRDFGQVSAVCVLRSLELENKKT